MEPQKERRFSDRATAIALRTYHRPVSENDDDKTPCLESWDQVVERVISHQRWLWERTLGRSLDAAQIAELDELKTLIKERRVSVAGRVLWLGGTELSKRRESCMFNCSYTHIETVYDVVDALWLLLQGCGVGFRPIPGSLNGMKRPLESIRIIRSTRTKADGIEHNVETYDAKTSVWCIKVGDSAVAWAKSVGKLIAAKYPARHLVLDFSEIRPAGTRLKSYGWLGSGDSQISRAYEAIAKILSNRADQLLSRIDILDIMNWLGTILSSRRSAQIAVFEYGQPEWEEFAVAKRNWWLTGNAHRQQSNNSLLLWNTPTRADLEHLFKLIVDSGGSEPGIINGRAAQIRAPWFCATNPCVSGDTWVATNYGYRQVRDLINVSFDVFVEGKLHRVKSNGFFWTGRKRLYEVKLESGIKFRTTDNHQILTTSSKSQYTEWKQLSDIKVGELVVMSNHGFIGQSGHPYKWAGNGKTYSEGMLFFASLLNNITDDKLDVEYDDASVRNIEYSSSEFYLGFMHELNMRSHGKLYSKHLKTVEMVQRLLIRCGVACYVSYNENKKQWFVNTYFDLRVPPCDKIESITPLDFDDVYDITVENVHEFSGDSVRMHNCGEYLACNKGFCNLSEVNLMAFNDKTRLNRALYLTARMNYRQTLVNLNDEILQEAWHLNNIFYRFCGVGITGVVGRPDLTEYDYKCLKNMAVCGAYSMALELDMPLPKNITVVKPSGSLSKIMGTTDNEVSEGVHRPLGRYIFNSVGFSRHDPMVERFKNAGYHIIEKPNEPETVLIKFPVKYDGIAFTKTTVKRPDGTTEEVEINDESAIDQLNRYLMLQRSWTEQNTSCTIYYSIDEVPAIITWLLENWNHGYVGTAFIFRSDPTMTPESCGYSYLPQEVVCKSTYDQYVAKIKPVDYTGIMSSDEMIDIKECAGGACPIR